MAKIEIKISLEKLIHDSFSELAQHLLDEHGVIVNSVSIDWQNMCSLNEPAFRVSSTRIDSERKILR